MTLFLFFSLLPLLAAATGSCSSRPEHQCSPPCRAAYGAPHTPCGGPTIFLGCYTSTFPCSPSCYTASPPVPSHNSTSVWALTGCPPEGDNGVVYTAVSCSKDCLCGAGGCEQSKTEQNGASAGLGVGMFVLGLAIGAAFVAGAQFLTGGGTRHYQTI
jgi:hypothetical protein